MAPEKIHRIQKATINQQQQAKADLQMTSALAMAQQVAAHRNSNINFVHKLNNQLGYRWRCEQSQL